MDYNSEEIAYSKNLELAVEEILDKKVNFEVLDEETKEKFFMIIE